MFNICILKSEDYREAPDWWVEEHIPVVTGYSIKHDNEHVVAYLEGNDIDERGFFALAHPFIFQQNLKPVVILPSGKYSGKEKIVPMLPPPEGEISVLYSDGNNIFISVAPEDVEWEKLFPGVLLLFANTGDYNIFRNHFNNLLNENVLLQSLLKETGRVKREVWNVSEKNRWNESQVGILETSLSLIRKEFQKDLKWYKDELDKVITWYRNNYEEMPPGIFRLGKAFNKIRNKLKFNK